jgi:hypothetical protein
MLYGYGTFELNREGEHTEKIAMSGHTQIYCTGVAFTRAPDPPWWLAYTRAINEHRGDHSMTWHDASFKYGYEAGVSDANDQIGRLRRRIDELQELAEVAERRLKTICEIKRALGVQDDDDGDIDDE